ncbi:REP-associated tyrosine transposase [Oceanobacter kriegii]|uniref:REP-associated tyrosine transposase n=1 Tax=Oceanobacter kriegii TaxID=64972 RepID=UPI000480033D|nr:transposase [Oceanobacter kriegii]
MKPAKGNHQLRIGRHSESGRIYLLTASVEHRQPLFLNFDLACAAIRAFTSDQAMRDNELLCWVLMPDHVHWLVQLHGDDLSRMAMRLKSLSARAVHQTAGSGGKLWQRSFHDHALRKEEDIKAVARYIVANPLRAGLARRVGDYPFWDAVWINN